MVKRRTARYVPNRYHNMPSVTDLLAQLGSVSVQSKSAIIFVFKMHYHLMGLSLTNDVQSSVKTEQHRSKTIYLRYQVPFSRID